MFPIVKEIKKTKYLVMVLGADQPTRYHESYEGAKKEAQRLCRLTWKRTEIYQVLIWYDHEITETVYKNII